MIKNTLVLGASLNSNRYSYLAIKSLVAKGLNVRALGKMEGVVDGITIYSEKKDFKDIHTISMYLNSKNQIEYYEYIVSLKPKRVIFNPGSENIELENILKKHNISYEKSCTLVLLSINMF